MAGVVGVIWVGREAEYFYARGWTGFSDLPVGQSHTRSHRARPHPEQRASRASRRMNGTSGAAWFETRGGAALLTMRVEGRRVGTLALCPPYASSTISAVADSY